MSARKAARIEFRAVTKGWGKALAVDNVSFALEAGTLTAILGPSGCGKTTTLRLIAGLEMPTSGRILIGDTDVTRLATWERDVSMVFQSYALFPHMTVAANVAYGLRSEGRSPAAARERAREALATVGLAGLEERLPSELSGGQQQRVAVARAIVLEPAVLLFDEPLSNLDARLRREMREEIRALQQRLGVTAVYVTHDQSEALAVSDRIVVMDRGRNAGEGSPRDLYERPESEFVARFMGEANLVTGVLEGTGAGARVRLDSIAVPVDAAGLPAGPVRCALRPEALVIARAGEGIAGKVTTAAYVGASMEYRVETALGSLFVVSPDTVAPLAPGTEVRLRPDRPPILLRG